MQQIEEWVESEFSHPKVVAIRNYIFSEHIVNDLILNGILSEDCRNKLDSKNEKLMVRWRVNEGEVSACWQDKTLLESFLNYYSSKLKNKEKCYCYISGDEDIKCDMHTKGIVSLYGNARIISSNDSSGFTYRGRFSKPDEALNIGYITSQKAHNALKWLVANQGKIYGGRAFVIWNPNGKKLPTSFSDLAFDDDESINDFVSYKTQLSETLSGYRNELTLEDKTIIASFDAATTGRLSLTYYNELSSSDFLERIEYWYLSCCAQGKSIYSPTVKNIIKSAFGTERDKMIDVDEKILSQYSQQLIHCIVDKQPIPISIVKSLVNKASNIVAYENYNNRSIVMLTACAVLRKHLNDRAKKEVWTLGLDKENTNRSYLFGRLLAIFEQVERATYSPDEKREPNAIRMQSVYSQKPMYARRIIEERLIPYYKQLPVGLRNYYKNIIGEIDDKLSICEVESNKKLDDVYVLGYSHQRKDLLTKKDNEKINETTEEE